MSLVFKSVGIRIRNLALRVLALYFLITTGLQGQIIKDTTSVNLLRKCVGRIYDLRFDEARSLSGQLSQAYRGHPVAYLLKGMITYWENYPLIPSSSASVSYEEDMRNCIRICEEAHDQDNYAEYLITNLGARGMLLLYYADNNLSDKVFPLAKSTYRHLRQSFDYVAIYPDFYFFTGLYNYYREAYPDAHPIYKMLAFLFPKGDKVKGLNELKTASENSIMLKAEALYFLTIITINFENNFREACIYSRSLHELYPSNPEYLADYIQTLLLAKKYDEAETLIRSAEPKSDADYPEAQISILSGILMEKKYHNYVEAKKLYYRGINDISAYGYYGYEYASFAWFGLSRISDIEGDKHNRKIYRRKALELTDYKKINFDE